MKLDLTGQNIILSVINAYRETIICQLIYQHILKHPNNLFKLGLCGHYFDNVVIVFQTPIPSICCSEQWELLV